MIYTLFSIMLLIRHNFLAKGIILYFRKKSVEDILYGTQEAINLSLSNFNVLQTSSLLSKQNSVASLYTAEVS